MKEKKTLSEMLPGFEKARPNRDYEKIYNMLDDLTKKQEQKGGGKEVK